MQPFTLTCVIVALSEHAAFRYTGGMAYQVDLETFHGPLDHLLYLVQRDEVDILDIPIAKLTGQFLEALQVMQVLDMELAGDFLVMAATLMEIKSRSLVPLAVGAEADDQNEESTTPDPRRELVKQLLEYRRYKDAAAALEAKAEEQTRKLPRMSPPEPSQASSASSVSPVRPVELWDLVSAFARILRESQAVQPQTLVVDDTPQHVYEEQIRQLVRQHLRVNLIDIFTPPHLRSRLVGLFLATLELIRRFEIHLEQPEPFGEIWLVLPPAETTDNPMSAN